MKFELFTKVTHKVIDVNTHEFFKNRKACIGLDGEIMILDLDENGKVLSAYTEKTLFGIRMIPDKSFVKKSPLDYLNEILEESKEIKNLLVSDGGNSKLQKKDVLIGENNA